jgi:hypothetical protein
VRFTLTPPAQRPFVVQADHDAAIAPDGSFVVYRSSPSGLVLRAIDELEGRPLTATTGARFPFVSADSRWVGFDVGGEVRRAAINGGAAILVCRLTGVLRGASWGDDGFIVLATSRASGLMRVSADGGEPKPLTTVDASVQERHVLPHVLPASRWVLFTVLSGDDITNVQTARIDALNLATGERKTVLRGGHDASYVDSGHLVYAATDMSSAAAARFRGSLRAVRFDPDRAEVIGDSITGFESVAVSINGAANYAVSRRGDLLYVPGSVTTATTSSRSLVWVNRKGVETPIIGAPPGGYAMARIDPGGTRIVLDIRDQTNDIWIYDIARRTPDPLDRDAAQDMSPLWTPDGKHVIWTSTRTSGNPNLFRKPVDGTGRAERLTSSPTNQFPTSITRDGATVALFGAALAPENLVDIFTVAIGSADAKAEPVVASRGRDFGGEISPDGRWLAYHSDESGEYQVYVRPFPDAQAGRRWTLSAAGGTRAAWARDGHELFYLDRDGMLTSVAMPMVGTSLSPGPAVKILKTSYYNGSSIQGLDLRAYDVHPDGQRFLMIKDLEASQNRPQNVAHMDVVLNWSEELKARLPAR